jgi:hypothetical protein
VSLFPGGATELRFRAVRSDFNPAADPPLLQKVPKSSKKSPPGLQKVPKNFNFLQKISPGNINLSNAYAEFAAERIKNFFVTPCGVDQGPIINI